MCNNITLRSGEDRRKTFRSREENQRVQPTVDAESGIESPCSAPGQLHCWAHLFVPLKADSLNEVNVYLKRGLETKE